MDEVSVPDLIYKIGQLTVRIDQYLAHIAKLEAQLQAPTLEIPVADEQETVELED